MVFPEGFQTLEMDVFSQCGSLKRVVFLGNVNKIRLTAFYGCNYLEEVYFLGDTPPAQLDNTAFQECSKQVECLRVYYINGNSGYEDPTFQAKFQEGTQFFALRNIEIGDFTASVDGAGLVELNFVIQTYRPENIQNPMLYAVLYTDEDAMITMQQISADDISCTFADHPEASYAKIIALDEYGVPLCVSKKAVVEPKAPRGRVQVANGTVVTDTGSLLRGCSIGADYMESAISYQQLKKMKEYGCNNLHVYGERASAGLPAGYHVNLIDAYVDMAEELGIYIILTIGDSTFDKEFVMDFWEFYAPRYKDKTHVIYEIQNEATAFGETSEEMRQNEQEAYDLIRSFAPDTHVMLYSYSRFMSWESVLADLEYLDVDWTNASVAWHGYGSDIADIMDIFEKLKAAGYPSMSTELPSVSDGKAANAAHLAMCEKMGCSWNHFVSITDVTTKDSAWKDPIEMGGVTWKPDFGTWPDPNALCPYLETSVLSREGSSLAAFDYEKKTAALSDGGYLKFADVTFATGPALLDLTAAAVESGGSIEVRMDAPDGTLVGTCTIAETGSLDTFAVHSCDIADLTGTRDFYLVYHGAGVVLSSFRFLTEPIDAFSRIEAEDYDGQHGVDKGSSMDEGGGMCLTAIQEGDYVYFENVDFKDGVSKFYARGASALCPYTIEIRIDAVDGPVIGRCAMPMTGGWTNWQTETTEITQEVTGRHTLYLIFVDGTHGGGFGNLNWIQFEA